MDCHPLLELDFTQHVILDHNHLIELIDLGVNDFVLNGFDSPNLNLVLGNLKERTESGETHKLSTYIELFG